MTTTATTSVNRPLPADTGDWLSDVLAKIAGARIGVFGDLCLDAYWILDTDAAGPKSLETGLPIQRVRSQRYSLGGAGNVVANLVELGVRQVHVVGVIGDDQFGAHLRHLLQRLGADTTGLIVDDGLDWQTPVYGKPIVAGVEQPRFDFGAFNTPSSHSIDQAIAALDRIAADCDVVILNQQVSCGVSTPSVIARINEVVARHPGVRFIVDARDHAREYRRCLLKVNVREASQIAAADLTPNELAATLRARTGQDVFLTRGEGGILVSSAEGVHEYPAVQVVGRTDPVGAGDTVVASIASALAIGAGPGTAAALANIAASVTVRKLQITGTASPAEIKAVGPMPDYIYAPDLAADVRLAKTIDETEFEIVQPLPTSMRIRHAIFDHDGTLSTLREGWERIMEPMMVRAILGPSLKTVSKAKLDEITQTAKEFIDQTTGIQTLVQMQGLVRLVRDAGFVPREQVLDEHGYKQVYNELLLQLVHQRVEKLRRGELASEDFQIKNAARLLRHLYDRGVKLYLASGTDEADVIKEAQAMGYADLFEGRIFGAVGDVNVEAKRIVLDRIMRENNLSGNEFITFGDGPVEMRETRKRGGVAVGILSDEVRGFGVNFAKRSRLIRGGAMLLVPDFSQLPSLLQLLQLD